jgi:Tol biopolymer transport system component
MVYSTEQAFSDLYEANLPKNWPENVEPYKLTASNCGDYFGTYSPDGKKIAFSSARTGNPEIWTCNRDGSDPRRMTFLNVHSSMPRWSPDGQWIVHESNGNILLMDVQGGKPPHTLVSDPSDERMPTWSHDGQWIYFGSDRSGEYQIFKVNVHTSEVLQLTKNSGFYGQESPDGKFLYFKKHKELYKSLYRLDIGSFEEVAVINESISPTQWKVTSEGIYFITNDPEAERFLMFYRYNSDSIETVGNIDDGKLLSDISNDEQTILLWSWKRSSDIYMVENFR